MTTLVGTQTSFESALINAIELDYDAAEAYQAAIDRIDDPSYKQKLQEFKQDHLRHIKELSEILEKRGVEVPTGPSIKQWLTKGKVVIANLISDVAVLEAMYDNEKDTNTAYERLSKREDQWEDARLIILGALDDERRHKNWLDSVR
jgi:rubrerythrin